MVIVWSVVGQAVKKGLKDWLLALKNRREGTRGEEYGRK